MAFADAMLLSCGGGSLSRKAQEANVPAVDPFTPRTANRTGPYHRSRQGFQVISSASLGEVIDATGENPPSGSAPPTRPGADSLMIDMAPP